MRDVEKMVLAGDAKATEVRDAFVFQVSKDIGSMACAQDAFHGSSASCAVCAEDFCTGDDSNSHSASAFFDDYGKG